MAEVGPKTFTGQLKNFAETTSAHGLAKITAVREKVTSSRAIIILQSFWVIIILLGIVGFGLMTNERVVKYIESHEKVTYTMETKLPEEGQARIIKIISNK